MQRQQQQQQLSYEEPYWAPSKSKPKYPYHLEIMKDFQLMDEVIPLHQHSFYLIGRSVNTNTNNSYGTIQLEHGSISRHHAIIQHASNGRVYLYDLSSTHGTYWNTKKNHKLKPLRYVPLRLGDKIIFGESTRTYILSVAKECEESVLNLEESLRDQSTQLQQQQQQQQKSTKSKKRKRNQDHTDDNDREEENEENEEAFEYDEDDERRYKRLRIEEQITPESLFDDNDEFFDRTMKRTKTSALTTTTTTVNPIETLHSLTEKQQSVYSELYLLKKQYSQLEQEYNHDQMFNKIKSTTTTDDGGHGEDDELDAYMNSITKGLRSETEQQLKSLKIQIEKWEKEHAELTELIKIAKPANQSVQSKDEKIAEIERDRLTKDMFYQTDRKKRLPITTQTSTTTTSTPLTSDKTKNDTTTSEKPLIEKKKPIIYGSAPSITTTATSTTTTSNDGDGDGDNRNNREVRLVPTVTPKPNQNQQ